MVGLPRACALLLIALLAACGKGPEIIVRTADGAGVTAEQIDQNPLSLLPPGGVAYGSLDVTRANDSPLGQRVLRELDARLPLPASAGFSRERDLSRVIGVSYSMKGLDFAGVAVGHFDRARIEAAATDYRGGALPGGLIRSEYAGHSLFTSQGVGFVIVTAQTALFGNEVGIRRCLDRIADARVADDLPPWVKELLGTQGATYTVGADLASGAITGAIASRLAFLQGASMGRGVGNFDPPGLHLAGTVTYAEHDQARTGADGLLSSGGQVNMWGGLLGLGQPIRKLETQAVGNDNQFVIAVDGQAIDTLMTRFLPPPPSQPSGPGWTESTPPGTVALSEGGTPQPLGARP